jgi:allantoinase
VPVPPPFAHWPLPGRPRIRWPGGARVAVWVAVNVERYAPGERGPAIGPNTAGLDPDPLNQGWRDYGPRVGFWRLMDSLERLGVTPSAPLNAAVCDHYPEMVAAGRERNWAWIAHGYTNGMFHTEMELEAERSRLKEIVERIERGTGVRPRGWLGPGLTETAHTPALLAELGLDFTCDWCNDDQPYPLLPEKGRIVSLPYAIEANDIPLLIDKGLTGPEYRQVLVDQFDRLYEDGEATGRVMAIPVHPFLIGQPFRIRYFEEALQHILARDEVWMATGDEIAEWYLDNCYDEAAAMLEAGAASEPEPA